VPKALASREQGANIVNIAQVYQRSGTLQVSFKDKGITSPADFAGKTIGNWGFGNEFEVFAAMTAAGLDPATDVTNVQQQFDMVGLLNGDIDAAEAMTYNEYAQVLEAVNPDTGELYTPDDFNVISYEDEGVGMLQDAIWADGSRLDDPEYQDTAVRSSPRRSRAGRSAATTRRPAPTSCSPRARSSVRRTSCGR
jgi:NitT/TauT family transport system substrate-binding protein